MAAMAVAHGIPTTTTVGLVTAVDVPLLASPVFALTAQMTTAATQLAPPSLADLVVVLVVMSVVAAVVVAVVPVIPMTVPSVSGMALTMTLLSADEVVGEALAPDGVPVALTSLAPFSVLPALVVANPSAALFAVEASGVAAVSLAATLAGLAGWAAVAAAMSSVAMVMASRLVVVTTVALPAAATDTHISLPMALVRFPGFTVTSPLTRVVLAAQPLDL